MPKYLKDTKVGYYKIGVGYADNDGDGIADNLEDSWGLDSSDPYDGGTLWHGSSTSKYAGMSYVEIYQDQANKTRREWNAACIAGPLSATASAARRIAERYSTAMPGEAVRMTESGFWL